MGDYLSKTFECFVGHAPSNSTGDLACASPGGSAAQWFVVYLVFNVSFNVLLLWLTKRMSATWATSMPHTDLTLLRTLPCDLASPGPYLTLATSCAPNGLDSTTSALHPTRLSTTPPR